MEDVTVMARHRGVAKSGSDRTKLHVLCKAQGYHLKKPQHVRVGSMFASNHGSLSQEGQVYCQLNVEALLVLHNIYQKYQILLFQ